MVSTIGVIALDHLVRDKLNSVELVSMVYVGDGENVMDTDAPLFVLEIVFEWVCFCILCGDKVFLTNIASHVLDEVVPYAVCPFLAPANQCTQLAHAHEWCILGHEEAELGLQPTYQHHEPLKAAPLCQLPPVFRASRAKLFVLSAICPSSISRTENESSASSCTLLAGR